MVKYLQNEKFHYCIQLFRFSGTVHGAGSAASTGGVVGSTVGPSLGYIGRRLQVKFTS